jgi:hypothetical protein
MKDPWYRAPGSRTGHALHTLLAEPYSGSVIVAGIALVVLPLLTAGFIFDLDWVRSWSVIGFPGALPPFFDLHVVTDAAGRCAATDTTAYPYLHADCNPWGQGLNYPPVWLLLGKLGVNSDNTPLLAMLFELPALGLMALLLHGRSIRSGLIALPLVLSPSVVLGFERGNIDIVEWILVCSAALMFSEHRKLRAAASLVLLAFAVVVKLIAVFCCTLAVRLRSTSVVVSVALVAFSLLYLYSLSDVLPAIRRNTHLTPYVSYGYTILFDRLEFLYGPRLGLNLTGLAHSWVPTAVVAFVALAAATSALVARRYSLCRLGQGSDGVAFLFGAGIYCGSFLLLGSNYAYRLMFLLLCLPQLLDWIENCLGGTRRLAYLLLGSCVISMWLKFHPEKTLHVNQISDWILFGCLTMIILLNGLYGLDSLLPRRDAASQPRNVTS